MYNPETGTFACNISFNGAGYGYFYLNGKRINAARYAWEQCRGKLAAGERVGYLDGNKQNLRLDNLYRKTHERPDLDVNWLRRKYEYKGGTLYHKGTSRKGQPVYHHVNEKGYAVTTLQGKKFRRGRLIWFYHHGKWPDGTVDHVNGNPGDDRIENLQDVSYKENTQRRLGAAEFKKYPDGLYRPTITHEGRLIRLGAYPTLEQAQSAYTGAKAVIRETIDDPCQGLA